MRNKILASLLAVGAFGGVATANPKEASHAATHAAAQAAVIFGPARTLRTAAPFSGEASLVGEAPATRHEHAPRVSAAGESSTAHVEPGPRLEPYLEPIHVAAIVAPYAEEIQGCFVGGTRKVPHSSHLSLTLVIGRNGTLRSLQAAVPGLPAKALRQISSCARAALAAVEFPARRNETTAVLPYFFQRTAAPDSGPQQSCWSAKGC